jgi:tetratricopeptide (TPR) repeat protein/transcriptional regulator with XRE-family HTH domain
LRAEARLTQEELAEAASLSPRSVSDLERGINRTARKDTAGLLADALSLSGSVRTLFVAAARGRSPAADVLAARQGAAPGAFAAAATRTLPRDITGFTGRQAELAPLLGTVAGLAATSAVAGIQAIDGMAGIGKTTFAVHAAHRLARSFPDGQFFLPLHAHTPGQRPVDPADALASLLLTAGVAAPQIPPGAEARAARWRDHTAGKKILLLLDDAAGHEQVRPLLPGTSGSLVLVTSRRRLAALEDAAVISLDVLPAADAVALLGRLAERPDLMAGAGPAEEIARLCGYLPLAIGMVASQLRHHPARTGAMLAAELAAASDRLAVMHAENLSVTAAFDLSYQDLSPAQQRLFRRLGLVPGPSFDAYAAGALDGSDPDTARRHLDDLYDQHLLTEPAPGRYRLHDLLREHASALGAADDPAACHAAAGQLLDYYLHTAAAASRHATTRASADCPAPPSGGPVRAPQLATPQQAATWLETERPNLHAATEYAAAHARPQHAIGIPLAISGFLHAQGQWDQAAVLYRTALAAARQAGDRPGQAAALGHLGSVRQLTGDYPAAAASFQQAIALFRSIGDRPGLAYALNDLGFLRSRTADYPAAAACHQEALALARDLGDRLVQADALTDLGFAQRLAGDYPAAAESHRQALALFRDLGHAWGQADALNHLGTLQRETGDYQAAAASQQQALAMYREFGHRRGEAWALNDLGTVQQETGDYAAASASYQQALELFRGLGHRLGEAETLNNLGGLSSRNSATGQARQHHAQALVIARDVGAPLEEARALEGIGHSHLQDGNSGQAAPALTEALTIYQRIGAPGARRVRGTLRRHRLNQHRAKAATGRQPTPSVTCTRGDPRAARKPSPAPDGSSDSGCGAPSHTR